MSDDLEQIRALCLAAHHHHGPQQPEFETAILSFANNPTKTTAFVQILKTADSDRLRSATIVFLHKSLKENWKFLSLENREFVRNELLAILGSDLSDDIFGKLMHTILVVYEGTEGGWPELVVFISRLFENGKLWRSLVLLAPIVCHMDGESLENGLSFCSDVCAAGLQSGILRCFEVAIRLLGGLVARMSDVAPFESHFPLVAEICAASESWVDWVMLAEFWSAVEDLVAEADEHGLPPEVTAVIVEPSARIGAREDVPAECRATVLRASARVLVRLPPELAGRFLADSLSVGAGLIAESETLDQRALEHFEIASEVFSHEGVFPLIREQLRAALESPSLAFQAAALLLFRVVFECFPESAYGDMDFILRALRVALSSGNPLLQAAALECLSGFPGSFASISVHAASFLPDVVAVMSSDSPEVLTRVFTAAMALLDLVDTPIPGLFDAVISTRVDPERRAAFVAITAQVVEWTEDFNDERCDLALALLEEVFRGESLEEQSSALDLALAVARKDEDQLSFLAEVVFPALPRLWQTENEQFLDECASFIANFACVFRAHAVEFLSPFLPFLVPMLKNSVKPEIRGEALRAAGELARRGVEVPGLADAIRDALKSGEGFLERTALRVIRRAVSALPSDAPELAGLVAEFVCNSPDRETVEEALRAATKLVSANPETAADVAVRFVQGDIGAFAQIPLFEIPQRTRVFGPFCYFAGELLARNATIADELCRFLIVWISQDELDAAEAAGAISEGIIAETISPDLYGEILAAVSAIADRVTDPGLMQNIATLLNGLIQIGQSLLVMELVPKIAAWREIAAAKQFGYADAIANIASLFLQIAVRALEFPEEFIVESLRAFPPTDIRETTAMAGAIIELARRAPGERVLLELVFAIARYVVWENVDKAKVPTDVHEGLLDIFRELCQHNPPLPAKIRKQYQNQRAKIRSINRVLGI
jgi:hypothetical protein